MAPSQRGPSDLDAVSRAMYRLRFRLAIRERFGDAYQEFFSDIMEQRYPGDFQRTRPWGATGDRKNDGYLRSQRTLYAVYAPQRIEESNWVRKIRLDFEGALPHWEAYFSTWTFVHNQAGLGPKVQALLLELEAANNDLVFGRFGRAELETEFGELTRFQLEAVLGPALTRRDCVEIGAEDVQSVLQHVAMGSVPSVPDLRPVPVDKVRENGLSADVEALLTAGRPRAPLVEQVLSGGIDPPVADKIAAGMRSAYEAARDAGLLPDQIFARLQDFVSTPLRGSTNEQSAALAVIAYFFDECDIFERP